MLNDCVNELQREYEKDVSLEDIDLVVIIMEQKAQLNPDDLSSLINFGMALRCRAARSGSKDDIERAIEIGQEILHLAHDNDSACISYFFAMALELMRRFGRTRLLHDLNSAITSIEQCVLLSSENHLNYSLYVS